MSTNYYAIVKLPTIHDEDEDRIFRFHIGKTGGGTIVNGTQFASFAQLVQYLRHTDAKIIDEYHAELALDELIKRFQDYSPEDRRRQYDWVLTAARNSDDPQQRWAKENTEAYWVDDEGYTVHRGAFF